MSNEMTAEIAALQAERDQLHTALTSIRCIAMGRDGYVFSDELGALVDELYAIASKAVAPLAYAKEVEAGDAQGSKAYKSERDQLRKDCHRLGEWHRDVAGQLQDAQVERDTLAAKVAELTEALKDMLSGWRYIRQDPKHREIYGVGWDRAQSAVERALSSQSAQQAAESEPRQCNYDPEEVTRDL